MARHAPLVRAEPGFSLPFFDRLAPPPPPALVAARLEALSKPGDVVLDLAGRGGWVGRAAVDRQRRAVSLESTPLTRLLAELVLRPPDLRHLDAAFQAMSASPRGQTSLKVAVGEPFTTRCATCGRQLPLDEVIWPTVDGPDGPTDAEALAAAGEHHQQPARKAYACPVCRGPRGAGQQTAPLDPADLDRARAVPPEHATVRRRLADRFPVVEGGSELVDALLDLHTPRQLVGLDAILDRIESDLRSAPVEAALRLAFLHALLPASRLNGYPNRIGTLRIQAGRVRPAAAGPWRERHPWLAFEDGIRTIRGFIQRLESGPGGAVQARLGGDLRALEEGSATAVVGVAGPSTTRAIGDEASVGRGWDGSAGLQRRIKLVLGQPPVRPSQERLSMTYWAAAWTIGREAAAALPLAALSGPPIRAPWGWQATALARSLASIEPSIARDGVVVQLVDGGPEALVSAALGGVGAGFRLRNARLGDLDDEATGSVELVPPGAVLPPGPRTRANVALEPAAGGAGDPDIVAGIGLFGAPERIDRRPFSAADARSTVVDVAVERLKARGEPVSADRLLGDVLVGLDRAGQLRRLVAERSGAAPGSDGEPDPPRGPSHDDVEAGRPPGPGPFGSGAPGSSGSSGGPGWTGGSRGAPSRVPAAATSARAGRIEPPVDQVDAIVAMIADGMTQTGKHRLTEVAPGRWWLADPRDREAAAAPLADRVEWAVFSLLSTAGPLSESAFLQRIAGLFGSDLPDEALVRACLQSYRSRASTVDTLVTTDDLLGRAQDHAELIALLADGGHRLGVSVWIGRREQARRLGAGRLADRLDERELRVPLVHVNRAAEEVAEVDCAWYVRGKLSFLFEVEWTAMLGEPILKRHARIAQDDTTVRFLVIAPERTELVRHKLERSPVLQEAFERDNWHILKWNHLRTFLGGEAPSLDGLEPYLGLDPVVERSGEQLDLFGGA
ncbi:MAG TPA: hypothetical protein VFJ71_08200 [Candidatus Limnocylindrales bacterium]|nr:hypothetical protein [Candidatus Limnocylindrales bacterium]